MSDRASARMAETGHGFGTAPVFLASVGTILGAILYLRMGYAVAHTGLGGTLFIILLGHLVVIPTALAVAEIATNRRVEGGGAYFIISRSFGTTIGGAIGVALFFSQAISVAFYVIAFAEAFRAYIPMDIRVVSIPTMLALSVLVIARGADLGVRALWVVAGALGLSLLLFFLGKPVEGHAARADLFATIADPDPFWLVFAIVFPAFTGMAAGLGLSGDLAQPSKSIPRGILAATATAMVIYVAVAAKLAVSASPEALAADQMIMARIAVWGPIIPIGLAAASLSSAIGSILVAPRTLQALGVDQITTVSWLNAFLARGSGTSNEPRNATLVVSAIAVGTVAMGSIDLVARVISMFFMVTYGALCSISALEHFSARPSYRPRFRSKWYISLIGAVMAVFLMFQMDPLFALLAILIMIGVYASIRAARGEDDLAGIFQAVMTQAIRRFQVKLQKATGGQRTLEWRPSVIMVNGRTFERRAPVQFLAWLCRRYGVGTYLHFIKDHLTDESFAAARTLRAKLIHLLHARHADLYVDTIISPSMRSALAQALQLPGVTGKENNTILFEFAHDDGPDVLEEIAEGCHMASAAQISSLVLRHSDRFFGARRQIDIWLTWHDYSNASLMILLAYILVSHPDWRGAEIRIFAAYPAAEANEQRERLQEMITSGRLPISPKNLETIPTDERIDFAQLVVSKSRDADLVILGFTEKRLRGKGPDLFRRHGELGDTLFVAAQERIAID